MGVHALLLAVGVLGCSDRQRSGVGEDASEDVLDTTSLFDVPPGDAAAEDGVDESDSDVRVDDPVADPAEAPPSDLVGHWLLANIGNCIDYEDWRSFDESGRYQRTLADRNACGPEPTLRRDAGTYQLVDGLLVTEIATDDVTETWSTTIGVVDRAPFVAALGTRVFLLGDDSGRDWESRWHLRSTRQPGPYEQRVQVTLSFDPPLLTLGAEEACEMTAVLQASFDAGTDAAEDVGTETITLACVAETDEAGWITVRAQGYLEQWDLTTLFREQGIWERHSTHIASLFWDAFEPDFYLAPSGGFLFNNRFFTWYYRTEESPPESVERR